MRQIPNQISQSIARIPLQESDNRLLKEHAIVSDYKLISITKTVMQATVDWCRKIFQLLNRREDSSALSTSLEHQT